MTPEPITPVFDPCLGNTYLIDPARLKENDRRLSGLMKIAQSAGIALAPSAAQPEIYERHIDPARHDTQSQGYYLRPLQDADHAPALLRMLKRTIPHPRVQAGDWRVIGHIGHVGRYTHQLFLGTRTEDLAQYDRFCLAHADADWQDPDLQLLRHAKSGRYAVCNQQDGGPGCPNTQQARFLNAMGSLLRSFRHEQDCAIENLKTNCFGLRRYLADSSFVIEQYGHVSHLKAGIQDTAATADRVLSLTATLTADPALRARYAEELDRHLLRADEVVEWMGKWDANHCTHFESVAREAIRHSVVSRKPLILGSLALAVSSYLHPIRESEAPSVHVGKPEQAMNIVLSVDRIIPCVSRRYGEFDKVLFLDEQGNRFSWWTKRLPKHLAPGMTGPSSFVVKGHRYETGLAITEIRRVRMLTPSSQDKPAALSRPRP